ncbi:DUF805 domain-containing protein [Sphingomonas sp.]|uniref:DUF805 domain-containing protein n=1 Tax=Sphingomonas sp. TaxID=28214 RepID=UPI003D6CA443
MEWMILPLKKYFQFSGRSRRKEYWMWILFLIIVSIVLMILDSLLGLGGRSAFSTAPAGAGSAGLSAFTSGGILTNIFTLATFIPGLAVSVRRLHDVNRSGWWILAVFVPYLIGFTLLLGGAFGGGGALLLVGGIAMLLGLLAGILLLVWMCTNGTNGPNRFGDDPKGDSAEQLAETFS